MKYMLKLDEGDNNFLEDRLYLHVYDDDFKFVDEYFVATIVNYRYDGTSRKEILMGEGLELKTLIKLFCEEVKNG